MLVFQSRNLVFLAIPKAASTSVEGLLGPLADRDISNRSYPKHITANQFFRRWKNDPQSEKMPNPDAFVILREPIDRLRSWYRYRQRAEIRGTDKSTFNISFEQFVAESISKNPAPFADIGNQYSFCTDKSGNHLVKNVFSFEKLQHLETFMATKFQIAARLPYLNSSPSCEVLSLSATMTDRLKQVRACEFDFFEQVNSCGWREYL